MRLLYADVLLALCAAAGIVGCSNPPSPQLAPRAVKSPSASVLGCWSLELRRWKSYYVPAGMVLELTDSAQAGSYDTTGYVARIRAPATDATRWRDSYWAQYARSDSIHVVLGDKFTGLALNFRPAQGELRGFGSSYTDVTPALHTGGPVRGVRIAC
jgi:hypothetical protein